MSAYSSDGPTSVAGKDVDALIAPTAGGLLHSRQAPFKVAEAAGLLPTIRWSPARKSVNGLVCFECLE